MADMSNSITDQSSPWSFKIEIQFLWTNRLSNCLVFALDLNHFLINHLLSYLKC
jgi:hypothetical protein